MKILGGIVMLSQRLKSARNRLRLTQEGLADKVNTTKSTISNYENGHSTPSNEMLVLLSDVLEVTTDYLLGKSENIATTNKVTVAGQEINLSIEELKLFNELKKHPIMFHDLASDPEAKVKELIKLYKMKKMFLEEDIEEYGDGFGELED